MHFISENLYHVYNQGNNKQDIFISHEDYCIFLKQAEELLLANASMIAYCLMPNHFHFLLHADERSCRKIQQGSLILDAAANAFRKLLSSYAQTFNDKYGRSGSLFRQKTKAKSLCDNLIVSGTSLMTDYPLGCFNYIHANPVSAGLVLREEDWAFSSYRDYAGLRKNTPCDLAIALRYGLKVPS